MKKIVRTYHRWRYRRLYRKLFFLYARKFDLAACARNEADHAFYLLTGHVVGEVFPNRE